MQRRRRMQRRERGKRGGERERRGEEKGDKIKSSFYKTINIMYTCTLYTSSPGVPATVGKLDGVTG